MPLSIANIGPHADTSVNVFDHAGTVNIYAGSERGKSVVIDAACLLLTGTGRDGKDFAREMINDAADKCAVSADVPGIGPAAVTLTRSGSWTRKIGGASVKSQADYLASMGRVGEVPALARFVMAPMLFPVLADKELGRPLRDLLLSALKPVDVRVVVAVMLKKQGLAFSVDKDPGTVKDAAAYLTKANTTRDQADGRLMAAKAARGNIAPAIIAPDDTDIAAAIDALIARDAWAAYDAATAALSGARSNAAVYESTKAAIQARIDAALPVNPHADKVDEARAVFTIADAWTEYDRAVALVASSVDARMAAIAERNRKSTARKELGDRPEIPQSVAITTNNEAIAKIDPYLTKTRADLAILANALAVAEADVAGFGDGATCSKCSQPWAGHAEARTVAESALTTARAAHKALADKLADAEVKAGSRREMAAKFDRQLAAGAAYDVALRSIGTDPTLPEAAAVPAAPTKDRPDAERIAWADGVLTVDREVAVAVKITEADRVKATAELASLAPVNVPNAPDAPTANRPDADAVAAAEFVKAAASNAKGSATARQAAVVAADAEIVAAVKSAEEAAQEASRASAMVAAYRQAPSLIAARQTAEFALPSWLGLRFPPDEGKGTPAIEVLIDGRPWQCASEGKRILADLTLRIAVRRVAGLEMLPIFVDSAQSWSGKYPAAERVIYLWTTEGDDGLTVEYLPIVVAA